ncbi:MAG: cell division protein ZapD [Coxiellaceae bacterium]|jgi:cell division protein ZapD|nr:cell division protein ZapD [Coxiellaceae bacterium]
MIYEQPLNEQIRLCLRLEYLFDQAGYYLNQESLTSFWDLHQILKIILELLQITNRPDIKNKLSRILDQYAYHLSQLISMVDVDQQILNNTIQQIEYLSNNLRANQQKIGQELREDEFLNDIQQRLYTPAGTCSFSLPCYQSWLQQKIEAKFQLSIWFRYFDELKNVVDIVLKILRESSSFKTLKASMGFHHGSLDSNFLYQLIRVKLSDDKKLFPEISVGHHRIAIHFFTLDISGKTSQISNDVSFELSCCKI